MGCTFIRRCCPFAQALTLVGRGRTGQARRTQAEELESVVVDPVAGLSGDLANDRPQTGVVDPGRPPAARADDVMMVRRLAADVGMLAGRQVQPFDGAELGEDLERPEDRRPPDAETPGSRRDDQLGGREMAVLIGDECRERCAAARSTDSRRVRVLS